MNAADAPLFTWSVHLARRRWKLSLAGMAGFVGISVAVAFLYGSPVFGLLSMAVLFGSTATYWLPRTYAVYEDRVEVEPFGMTRPVAYAWTRFRACFGDETTLFLSPTGSPGGLARYRGLVVHLPPDSSAIAIFIAQRIAP